MTTPADVGRQRRRRRRGKAAAPAPVSAATVIAEARPPTLDKSPEAPMSAAEVARMKATLRFLREHRSTLKLKVNAAEDLLLNGRREPTHRGLCQHLLSKLDRTRVLQAAERMPPAQATEFLAGIVRFAPEVPYLLEFLRAVKKSAHPRQAAAALTQALERLDFSETSSAQMRDLLQLIVDVFPVSELPVFLFSLLAGAAFRSAFDRSSEGLPSSLAELLLPLRSLHRAIGRRGGRRDAPQEARLALEQVREGALLMLGTSRESLLELAEALRRQLLEAGSDALGRSATAAGSAQAEALLAVFGSLEFRDAAARAAALQRLASGLLRAGQERFAAELLRVEQAALGEARWAQHWLAALGGTRVGNLALERRGPRPPRRRRGNEPEAASAPEPNEPPAERWQRAFHVPTQREVLVRFADPAAPEALRQHAELRRRALFSGLAPLVEAAEVDGRAHLALAWLGPALPRRVHESRLAPELLLGWCQEACRLLNALGALGLELPDAAPARFSVDDADRLWLVDVWGLRATEPHAAQSAHLAFAKQLSRELLATLDRDVLSSAAAQAFESASNLAELAAALDPH